MQVRSNFGLNSSPRRIPKLLREFHGCKDLSFLLQWCPQRHTDRLSSALNREEKPLLCQAITLDLTPQTFRATYDTIILHVSGLPLLPAKKYPRAAWSYAVVSPRTGPYLGPFSLNEYRDSHLIACSRQCLRNRKLTAIWNAKLVFSNLRPWCRVR